VFDRLKRCFGDFRYYDGLRLGSRSFLDRQGWGDRFGQLRCYFRDFWYYDRLRLRSRSCCDRLRNRWPRGG
jgi:hypothetical protein